MSRPTIDNVQIPIDEIPLNVAVFRYVDAEFIYVDINDAAQKTDGVKKIDLIGEPVLKVFPGVSEFGLIDVMSRVYESGLEEEIDLTFYEDERISGWRNVNVRRMENSDILVFFKDMTDYHEREGELKSLGLIVDNSMNEVYIFDAQSLLFTYVNKEAERNIEYTFDEMKKLTPVDIKPDMDAKRFKNLLQPLVDGTVESLVFEAVHRRKSGRDYTAEIRLQLMDFGEKKSFVVMAHDISIRVKMEEMLHQLATIDSLTGIYNRHQTNEELDIEIERSNRYDGAFALVMLDLDYFKNINDTYGHDTGDYVLKEFSDIVSTEIRECDRFGRWGGEEFILILPELDKDQAIHVAEKLRASVASNTFKDVSQVTVSIGVAVCQADDTKKDLLKRVDDAMYQAKKAGRNTVKFN